MAKALSASSSEYGEDATRSSLTDYLPIVDHSQPHLDTFSDGLMMQPGVTEATAAGYFAERQINYAVDGLEADNAPGARNIVDCTVWGTCLSESHTLYRGALLNDADVVPIAVADGKSYTITTSALINGVDTYLELLASDGVSVKAANDDQANCGDPGLPACSNNGLWFSSKVIYFSTATETLYVRVTATPYLARWIGAGGYGGYTLTVTAN